ncbi:unnamed protein product [Allacma fusca]|uniref:Peroxin-19 n=1 Tax=Allacma fusca TaxID=39272 RepID=A0A8J2PL74_9HEXA|nr:unnamed protein product [Allacma fusca]
MDPNPDDKARGADEATAGTSNVTVAAGNAIVDDPELDALLDDALQDFDKPLPETKRPPPGGSSLESNQDMNQIWSEEFIKEATVQFEKKMREYAQKGSTAGQPGGDGPDSLQQFVEAATKAAVGEANPGFAACINDAMKNLSSTPAMEDPMGMGGFNEEELAKLMNSFSLGENAEDGDVDEILPFMTNMMQKLLSKELLQPVLADIVDRYPDWLADNREKLSATDFDKYNGQYDSMKKILEEYAKEKENDTEQIKQKRFDSISELMLKVQYAGPPPKELVGDMEGATNAGLFPNPADLGSGECSVM